MRYELREKLFEAFRKAEVDMPYETVNITPLEIAGPSAS
jgi:hypothetical protein